IGSAEYLARIDADLAICRRIRRAIGDETADDRILTPVVDRGNTMPCRERNDPLAPAVEERIVSDDERASTPLDQGRKCMIKVGVDAGIDDLNILSELTRRGFDLLQLRCQLRTLGVDENADHGR